ADLAGCRVAARRAAPARAGRADYGGVHGQLPSGAEDALGEVKIYPDSGVAAAPRPAARAAGRLAAAEEGIHDVAEREPGTEAARTARGRRRVTAALVH